MNCVSNGKCGMIDRNCKIAVFIQFKIAGLFCFDIRKRD